MAAEDDASSVSASNIHDVPAAEEDHAVTTEDDAAAALVRLTMEAPPALFAAAPTEEDHVSRAQKQRVRRKRAQNNAHKLRRSTWLMAKEEASFEAPKEKAARVQQAKFNFTSASRHLRDAISRSYLLVNPLSPSDVDHSLCEIAAACGASEEEVANISGATASPSTGP